MCCCRIMVKWGSTLAALLFSLSQPASATEYYLDPLNGNDASSGTRPDIAGADGPWRSLAHLQNVNLMPGDRVLLRCDGLWREPLKLRLRGAPNAPIIIAPFGECQQGQRPEIRPSSLLAPADFERDETGWSAPLKVPPGLVSMDGTVLQRARFPATGYLPLRDVGGAATPRIDALPVTADSLRGADWIVRSNDYSLEERRIYGVGAKGSLILARPFSMQPVAGAGYFLEGLPWMLATAGDWAYKPDTERLVLRDQPSQPVEVSAQDVAVTIRQSEHVQLQGLAIRLATRFGVEVADSRDIALQDVEISDVGDAFVRADRVNELHITGLRGYRSQRDGVVAIACPSAEVRGSVLEDVGVSRNPRKSIAAILIDDSPAPLVNGNHIRRAGYAAIMFGKGARIENNVIEDACMQLADCGAIYTSGARKQRGVYNALVTGNLISHVPGNIDGTAEKAALTAGIYLDDESSGIEVRDNFVEHAQRGIFSKADFSSISGNTLFSNERGLMLYGPGTRGGTRSDANVVLDNIVVSLGGQMPALVSAWPEDAPLVDVLQNRFVSHNALPAEVWLGTKKLAPPIAKGQAPSITGALSLVNTSDSPRAYSCPLALPACAKVKRLDGTSVVWPLQLEPGQAVVLLKGK